MRFPFSSPNQLTSIGSRQFIVKLMWQIFPSLIAAVLVAGLTYSSWVQAFDHQFYNNFTVWRGDRPWDQRIAIIAIDDESIREFGRFPWNRDRYKQLIEKIRPAQASVIAFDILWTEPTREDADLSQAIENSANNVLAMAWERSGAPLFPVASLSNATVAIGHILKREDTDGIVRQLDLQVQDIPALSLAMLQTYDLTTQAIATFPDLNRPLWLNWTNKAKSMTTFSFRDVINGKVPIVKLRNKIILVGVTAIGIDALVTPFERNPPVSGVHLHAIALRNLLQNDYLKEIALRDIWLISLCLSLCMSLLISRRNLWLPLLAALVMAILCLVSAYFAFVANHWLAVSTPILLVLCTGGAIALQSYWQIQRSLQTVQQRLRRATSYDALTDLANRELMEARLQYLLTNEELAHKSLSFPPQFQSSELDLSINPAIADQQKLFGIIWLTLNRFKTISDTFGYKVANLLLVEVAQRLQAIGQSTNANAKGQYENTTIAKFDGAEFVILLENLENEQVAIALAKKLQRSLANPFRIQQQQIDVSTNIGLKFHGNGDNFEEQPVTSDSLLRDADTAMSFAKRLGSNSYRVFENAMREHILSRLEMEQDLRKAVSTIKNNITNGIAKSAESSEFMIYYQPILSLHNMQIVGLEALIRWQHPEKGFISPAQFIPLAEETSLIIPIGDWIMEQACSQLYIWHQAYPKAKDLTMSVNLSAKQLVHDDVLTKCLHTLERSRLEPKYLKIELTESSLMENPQFAIQVLQKMREQGIQIYIDDFGTGYSSLAYLHEFPFDGLKIDRSFVNNIYENTSGSDIIQAIVTLANSMNAHIVAEGIETLEQLHYLQNLLSKNGDGQGFFLFRPLSAEAIATILAA